MITSSYRAGLAIAAVAVTAIACANDPILPEPSPLTGLTHITSNDTGTTPPDSVAPGPGFFRGTVRGTQPGPDSIGAPLSNVRVTAYPRVQSSTDTLGVGPTAGSVLTNASGVFQLPTLPGGQYIVTFNPPDGSTYRGVWTTAFAHPHSGDSPWFIFLAAK